MESNSATADLFTGEELEKLAERGYQVIEVVGSGFTRDAVRVKGSRGDANKTYILKWARTEIDPRDSVTAAINVKKRDVNEQEVNVANRMSHPGVADVVDSFVLNGKRTNVERDIQGRSLASELGFQGKFKDMEVARNVTGQLIDAVLHAHSKGILHRDIKPENIVLSDGGRIVLTDWQNAATLEDIALRDVPSVLTKGATKYTPRYHLNSFVHGHVQKPGVRDDVHAFGATLYKILTGEDAFDYALRAGANGKEVELGDGTIGVELYDGNRIVTSQISPEEHELKVRDLKKKMRKARVPKVWRNFVYGCLTEDSKKGFRDMNNVSLEFEKTKPGYWDRAKRNLAKAAVPLTLTGSIAVTLPVVTWVATREPAPKLSDLLTPAEYDEYSLKKLYEDERARLYHLVLGMQDSVERLPGLEKEHSELELEKIVSLAKNVRNDVRLTSSWLRACYLHPDLIDEYQEGNERRLEPSYVPENFAIKGFGPNSNILGYGHLTEQGRLEKGAKFLKHSIDPNNDVALTFANYFSTFDDVVTAKVRAESNSYLSNRAASTYATGFSSKLPFHQARLIDTALGLYLITDENGNIDKSRIPEKVVAAGGRGGLIHGVRLKD